MSSGVGVLRRMPPALLYYASYGITPLLGLLQTKVLTTLLDPSDFGRLQLFLPVVAWCVTIGGLGLPTFVVRFYSRDGIRSFQEGLWLLIAVNLLLSLGLLAAAWRGSVAGATFLPATAAGFLAAVVAMQLFALVRSLLRASERHLGFNALVILERCLSVCGLIVTVVLFPAFPVEACLLGGAVGTGIALLVTGLRDRGPSVWRVRRPGLDRVRALLAYGLPTVVLMMFSDLFTTANRYVIVATGHDAAMVARFVVGYTITSFGFQALTEPLITYLHPRVFRAYEAGRLSAARQLVSRYLRWYLAAGVITMLALGLAERWVVVLVTDRKYLLEPGVFPVLLLASFLLGMYRFLATHYYLRHSTLELAVCYGIGFIGSVSTAAVLARPYGLHGVAAGLLCGAILLCLVVWWRGRHALPLRVFGR